jgi:DNA-binding IscR family transcriptional regulator
MDQIWLELRETLEKALRAITLEDLCQRKNQRAGNLMYYI